VLSSVVNANLGLLQTSITAAEEAPAVGGSWQLPAVARRGFEAGLLCALCLADEDEAASIVVIDIDTQLRATMRLLLVSASNQAEREMTSCKVIEDCGLACAEFMQYHFEFMLLLARMPAAEVAALREGGSLHRCVQSYLALCKEAAAAGGPISDVGRSALWRLLSVCRSCKGIGWLGRYVLELDYIWDANVAVGKTSAHVRDKPKSAGCHEFFGNISAIVSTDSLSSRLIEEVLGGGRVDSHRPV